MGVGSFQQDESFDAKAKAKEARSEPSGLQAGISGERLTQEQADAKALRDRTFTHLRRIVPEIREADRDAYRNDESMARRFASDYRRKHRVSAKRSATPVTPEG